MIKTFQLDKDVNFITAETLLYEVANELSSYHERSLVDDSIFYPRIRHCLSRLGSKIYPLNSTVVKIVDYKGILPLDFHKLVYALGCTSETIQSTPNENPQLREVTIEQDACYTPSTTCVNECGEHFKIVQTYDTYAVEYNEFFTIKVSSTSYGSCAGNCFNKLTQSPNEVTIKNGKIITNFSTGSIYIEYLQDAKSIDGDLLIPDFPQVTEWIKQSCILRGLEYMWMNDKGNNMQQKISYLKSEVHRLEENARYFMRANSFKELYNIRKTLWSRYTKFHQIVYGPKFLDWYGR